MGFEIHLASPPPAHELPFRSVSDREWFERLDWRQFPLDRKSINPFAEARAIRNLTQIVRSVAPQIVHSVTPKGNLYAGLAVRGAKSVRGVVGTVTGLGYVFSSSELKARLLRPILVQAYRHVFGDPRTRVVFQNPTDRALFLEMGIVRAERTQLVPGSGVDTAHFAVMPEPAGSVRALFLGRLLRDKGVVTLAEAARILKRRDPSIRIELLGDLDPGNPASIERADLEAWRAEDLLDWTASVADVRPRLAASHMAVLPSLREGVPMALLEAASCGRAMVATDAPGCRDAVQDGVTGLLTPVENAEALAEAILTLAHDADRRRKMGLAARARAEQEFSKERIASLFADVYRECLEARV